jgi:RNA polymerase sigma-70 factor (ECF subfamily)
MGLLGTLLLQESRRTARTSPDGDLILLEQQDRSLWNKDYIAEGISLTERALASRRFGAYTLQAAITRRVSREEFLRRHLRTGAKSLSSTTSCFRFIPSPVVELNRAVAIAECEGPEERSSSCR